MTPFGSATRPRLSSRGRRAIGWALVVVLFVGLTLAWLWPLPARLATHVAGSPYWWDGQLNAWILAEVGENLAHLRAPLAGRILHPHAHVLAYSENLLTLAAVGRLVPGGPIFVHNILLLLGIALTGVAMFAYLRPRVGHPLGALLGALLFTYAPWRLGLLSRIQLVATPLIPLTLLGLEGAILKPTLRRWVAAAALAVAQLGVSIYYGFHLVLLAVPVLAGAILLRPALRRPSVLARMVFAGALALVATAGALSPYLRLADDMGFERSEKFLAATSGTWKDLETTSDLMRHHATRAWVVDEKSAREPVAYPGQGLLFAAVVGAFACLLVASLTGLRTFRSSRPPPDAPPARRPGLRVVGRLVEAARSAWQTGAQGRPFGAAVHLFWVGLALALFFGTGPDAHAFRAPYGRLVEHLPALKGLRYPSRFVVPLTFALATLGAMGLGAVLSPLRGRGRTAGVVAAVVACALGTWELWTVAVPLKETPAPEPAYSVLRSDPTAHAVAELPYDGPLHEPRVLRNLAALVHGLPTVGGYTGYDPPLLLLLREVLGGFPDADSRALLAALGVDRVLIHWHEHSPGARVRLEARLRGAGWLTPTYRDDGHTILAVSGVAAGAAAALRREVAAFRVAGVPPEGSVPSEGIRLSAQHGAGELGLLLDRDPTTRWTTGHRQGRGETWLTAELTAPERLAAVWLDTRKSPLDFPRGVRLEGRGDDGRWHTLLEQTPYLPLVRLAAAPARTWVELRFPPVRVDAIRLTETGRSTAFWGSAYGIRLERARP